MNKYRSHKTVSAFKITEIRGYYPGGVPPKKFAISGESERVEVTASFAAKHGPHIGGYFVRYQDGYESFSPAEAFEGGYTLIPPSVEEAKFDPTKVLKEKVLKEGETGESIVCRLKGMETTEVVTVTTRTKEGDEKVIETTTIKEWDAP